jgi:UDP-N-acetyl-D-mannosaminuronic acid dehydrogenase
MMHNIERICCLKTNLLIDVLNIYNIAKSYNLPSGIGLVIDENKRLIGTVSEGDVRRSLLKNSDMKVLVSEIMTTDPITFKEGVTISEILDLLPGELLKRNRKAGKYLNKIIIVSEDNIPIKVFDYHELWEQKVAIHRHLVVIGLGYVGLTMAVVMADAGFMVTGVEIDEDRFNLLSRGESYIHEVGLPELLKEQLNKNLFISKSIPKDGDVFIISVGTPIGIDASGKKRPQLQYLLDASEKIGKTIKNGDLVVLRSTVPIGTCRNVVKTKLEEISGLRCGIDFHLSFAPERTAEGKALRELRSLPQIIGGFNKDSTEATAAIFRDLTPTIVKVESLEAAEMAKLMNNTFRDYIFAYANQMAQIASEFNLNVFNVIKAANEGYVRDPIPLPSPGVGGPCLTKDPHIFASVAEMKNFSGELFENGREINESMHSFIFTRVVQQLEKSGKRPVDCNILICGLAFKGYPETGDIRNSTSVEIAGLFKPHVKAVYAFDAVADQREISAFGLSPVQLPQGFDNMDAVLFLNNHKYFEKINIYEMVRAMNENPIVFDGWDLFRWEDIIAIRPCSFLGLSFVKSSITEE